MTKEETYQSLCRQLSKCNTPEQIDNLLNVSYGFLVERYGAVKEWESLVEAGELKKSLPTAEVSWIDNMR